MSVSYNYCAAQYWDIISYFKPCSIKMSMLFYNNRKASVKCCVFRPAFGCCRHPKTGWNTFFSHFQPFLFISNLFQWFHTWNQQKTSEKEQKMCFLFTPQSRSTCKSWSTPCGGFLKLSFSVDFWVNRAEFLINKKGESISIGKKWTGPINWRAESLKIYGCG